MSRIKIKNTVQTALSFVEEKHDHDFDYQLNEDVKL